MERQTSTTSEHITDIHAKVAFKPEQVLLLRSYQKELYNTQYEAQNSRPEGMDEAQLETAMTDEIKDYLGAAGVAEDDPNYQRLYSELRQLSYDKISDSAWRYGELANLDHAEPGTAPKLGPNGEDILRLKREELFGPEPLWVDTTNPNSSPTPDPAEQERQRNIEEARQAVEEAREKWATESAKRQGRMYSKEENDERDAKRGDYYAKVNALGRLELAEQLGDATISDDDKKAIAVGYGLQQDEKLRQLTTEKLQGTKVSKLIKWMNKGNVATRIAKGVAIGASAGLVGAFVAGGLGAGVAAVGIAGTTRFARGFALRDKDQRGMQTAAEAIDIDKAVRSIDGSSGEDYLAEASQYMSDKFEDDTKKEQSKRRKAAMWGLGTVAVGAAVGYGVHAAIESVSGTGLKITDLFRGENAQAKLGGVFEQHNGSGPAAEPNVDGGAPGGPGPDGGSGGGNESGGNPPVTPAPEGPTYNPEASWIDQNEGFYKTFEDMGIPHNEWNSLLEKVGPQLHQHGWAYKMPDGTWGISRSGVFPKDMLELIQNNR